jgi:class 3 adenylate cyclase
VPRLPKSTVDFVAVSKQHIMCGVPVDPDSLEQRVGGINQIDKAALVRFRRGVSSGPIVTGHGDSGSGYEIYFDSLM